jgi:hypothetical protein
VPITTNVVSSNPVHGEVYSMQPYVIMFVSGERYLRYHVLHSHNYNRKNHPLKLLGSCFCIVIYDMIYHTEKYYIWFG